MKKIHAINHGLPSPAFAHYLKPMAADFAKRVLVVDDEAHIRTYLRLILQDLGAKEVHEAGDGPNALMLYQQQEPELVLLDFNLPGEDGLAVLEQLLKLDPRAPVVMMTAVASREVVEHCAASGALNYIRKDTPREGIAKTLRETWAGLETVEGESSA